MLNAAEPHLEMAPLAEVMLAGHNPSLLAAMPHVSQTKTMDAGHKPTKAGATMSDVTCLEKERGGLLRAALAWRIRLWPLAIYPTSRAVSTCK